MIRIFVCIIFISIQCYCQFTQYSDYDWTETEINYSKEKKTELLSRVKLEENFDISYLKDTRRNCVTEEAYSEFLIEELKNYHILDINGDSILDVVYEGPHNPSEGDNVAFFINDSDSLELALFIYGNIESIISENNCIKKINFIILPCCANYITFRDYYTIKSHPEPLVNFDSLIVNTPIKFISKKMIAVLDSSEALNYCHRPDRVVNNISGITNKQCYVTFAPERVKNKLPPESSSVYDFGYIAEGNNQIAKLNDSVEITVLADMKNKKYFFIKTKNLHTSQSIFGKDDVIFYGWVESKYIKLKKY